MFEVNLRRYQTSEIGRRDAQVQPSFMKREVFSQHGLLANAEPIASKNRVALSPPSRDVPTTQLDELSQLEDEAAGVLDAFSRKSKRSVLHQVCHV